MVTGLATVACQERGLPTSLQSIIVEGALVGMRRYGFLAVLACGLLAVSPATAQASLSLVDARVDKVDKTKRLSGLITSCIFNVYKLGDRGRPTDRMSRLKADLETGLSADWSGKTVEVLDYRSYLSAGATGRASADAFVGGIVAPMISYGVNSGCAKKTESEGWFEAKELSSNNSPIVTHITVRIDGVSYTSRSVYSPTMELLPGTRGLWIPSEGEKTMTDEKAAPEVDAAFAAANQKLISEIRKAHETATPQPAEPPASSEPSPG